MIRPGLSVKDARDDESPNKKTDHRRAVLFHAVVLRVKDADRQRDSRENRQEMNRTPVAHVFISWIPTDLITTIAMSPTQTHPVAR